MRYLINIAMLIPRGDMTETRHHSEVRLETIDKDEALDSLMSLSRIYPLTPLKNKKIKFKFKLVGIEEVDILEIDGS